eukprot:6677718-Pyramimonas_sp.AAC.1
MPGALSAQVAAPEAQGRGCPPAMIYGIRKNLRQSFDHLVLYFLPCPPFAPSSQNDDQRQDR